MLGNRRQWFRIYLDSRAHEVAGVNLTRKLQPLKLRVINLSAGGMLCRTDQPVKKGGLIQVTFDLPTGESLTLKARVLRRTKRWQGQSPAYTLGCQFVGLTEAERDALVGLVFYWELEARRAGWSAMEAQRGYH